MEKGAGSGLDKVEREDEAIVENVQMVLIRGCMTEEDIQHGRETGTHHFHSLIAEFMND